MTAPNVQDRLKVISTPIDGVLIIEPKVYGDERGWFSESFNEREFLAATDLNIKFVQDNHSFSRQWTLRGLHYQVDSPQGKLVRVSRGAVFDVVVDLRVNSPTFGGWFGAELSAKNFRQLYAPPGIAHGFLALSDVAETLYKVTSYYDPTKEVSLLWSDPTININWPILSGVELSISHKDMSGLSWSQAPKFE
jgi:dTDP-4-dehydrorhamnose 3,5-epimerase